MLVPCLRILVRECLPLVPIARGALSGIKREIGVRHLEGESIVQQLLLFLGVLGLCMGVRVCQEGGRSHTDGESVGGLDCGQLGEHLLVQLALGY